MGYSIAGTTLTIYEKTVGGLALFGTIDSGTIPTTADIFAPGCKIIDLSTGISYYNSSTSGSASWVTPGGALGAGTVIPSAYNIPEARTATSDGLTTGQISATTTHVVVTSANANNIIVLPAPVVGRQICIDVGATGFELRTTDPTTIGINGGTGSAAESAIAASSTCFLVCVSLTSWKGYFMDADGDLAKIEAAA